MVGAHHSQIGGKPVFVDHIAVLTSDLEGLSASLPAFCHKHPIESFPSEGTREQYIELAAGAPNLLLLQPIAPGPYARALSKRGPGLHHLGARTASLDAQIPNLSRLGLRLHPISIQTLKQGVAWLCRPGLPFLIELAESAPQAEMTPIELGLPVASALLAQLPEIFSNLSFGPASSASLELRVAERLIRLPLS